MEGKKLLGCHLASRKLLPVFAIKDVIVAKLNINGSITDSNVTILQEESTFEGNTLIVSSAPAIALSAGLTAVQPSLLS